MINPAWVAYIRQIRRPGNWVRSRYRSPWYGVVLANRGVLWINHATLEVRREMPRTDPRFIAYNLPFPGSVVLAVFYDGKGNPLKSPRIQRLNARWLRLTPPREVPERYREFLPGLPPGNPYLLQTPPDTPPYPH